VKFYTRYDRPKKDFGLKCEDESLTRQSEADSADINKIMERFDRTGQLPHVMKAPPQYGDARIVDFQTAKQIVIDAELAFNELPAKARQYFNHDPENLMSALTDPKKEQDLLDLGIIVQRDTDPLDVLKQIASNTDATKVEAPAK